MVKYSPRDAPQIGPGRWTWPITSLQNDKLISKITARGTQLQDELDRANREHTHRSTSNPQLLWHEFKNDICKIAKQSTKDSYHRVTSRINALTTDLNEITTHSDLDTNEDLRSKEAWLASEKTHLENVIMRSQKEILHAKIANHGEKLGSIWSAISKDCKPHDLIRRLKIPNSEPPQYERDTVRMACLTRNYHEALQQDGLPANETEEEFEWALTENLHHIPGSQLLEEPTLTSLNWNITQAQVKEALHLSKNGSATGVDGCPYELWKTLHLRYNAACQMNKTGFNITKVLTEVFNDIQIHDVDPNTPFALGWMCPIYKKKDPTEISNYRPITLMNTDYKILTKVLALQLTQPIYTLVHEDQVGFITQQSIFNHIRLARAIITYAEVMEEDGVIIALDQEKAYDKIRHDYLWKTLEVFHIPPTFIKTVKSLYQHAHTKVAINGVFSDPFHVTRGVRQGDPLSCPLFDLAIEPLACMLRSDANLQGIPIPGLPRNVLVTMFADDTTLFLSKYDRFDDVQITLDKWCRTSGVKFNIEKTEIIPIGTIDHRSVIPTSQKINPLDQNLLDNKIHIAKDGDATHSLGTWIGNHVNDLTPWEPILDKINKALASWHHTRPTLHGKRLIIQSVIGGHTQFLTKAQGMPTRIGDALTKIIRDFLWEDDSSPRIALDTLFRPIEEGGLNLLDINSRNDAIDIVWLKTYLNFSQSRPTWAHITDLIINASTPPGTSPLARINTFLQSWDPPTRGPRLTLLNNDIVRMLHVAKKYRTNLTAIRLTPHICSQLPAWYHPFAKTTPLTTSTARCLLKKHSVSTVADLVSMSARLRTLRQLLPHIPDPLCTCTDCSHDRTNGCRNPHACATDAMARTHQIAPKWNPLEIGETHDNLSLSPARKARNREAQQLNGAVCFDPSITCKNDLAECFRIFTNPEKISPIPAHRPYTRGINHRH